MRFYLSFLIAIFIGLVAPVAQETTATAAKETSDPVDPVEQEYYRILELDDTALTKIDEWIRSSQRLDAPEAEAIALVGKIQGQIKPVRAAYDTFIKEHPDHARARLTYASFLTDIGEEHLALPHLLKATEIDPKLPAAWNNLANYYGHNGDVKKAFTSYEKAIEISPEEPVYYHNFGTTVFLFRKDVKEHYQITEEQVFDKALALYAKAQQFAPDNFDLAEDIAQTYYGIRTTTPPTKMARPHEALKAWKNAIKLAPSDFEQQGVNIHLTRVYLELEQFELAKQELAKVTLPIYQDLKDRIGRRVPGYQPVGASKEDKSKDTPEVPENP